MTAVMLALQGRPLRDAVEHCLRSAASGATVRGRGVSIWLSGDLARPFLFGPVRGLRGWAEASTAAKGIALQSCGIEAPCHVMLEGDPSRNGVLGTAVRDETIEVLYRTAATLRLRIKSIRAAWAEALDQAPVAARGAAVIACHDVDSSTLIGWRDDDADLASTYSPRPGPDEIDSLLQRLQLSRDLALRDIVTATINIAADGVPVVSCSGVVPVAA